MTFSKAYTHIFKVQTIQNGRVKEERYWATFQESIKCIYKPWGVSLSNVEEMQAFRAGNDPKPHYEKVLSYVELEQNTFLI